MSHNIENKNGKNSIAFLGLHKDIWHHLGQEMKEGMSIEDWAREAGLDWEAECYPTSFFRDGEYHEDEKFDVVRKDTNYAIGNGMTARWKVVQPAEVLDWFDKYIKHDPRFQLDVAGCLLNGSKIWATAKFNGDVTVGGDLHQARLLMTTGFDGTLATTNKMTMTRVVCNNTLDAALFDKGKAVVKTVHSAKFNADVVGKQLAKLADSVETYKAMGDAMAKVHIADDTLKTFFAKLLKMDDNQEENSTRKVGMFNDMVGAYNETVKEGTEPGTKWCALNAVTRYVDHVRSTRTTGGMSELEGRFVSAQFSSGAAMKAEAVKYLTDEDQFAKLLKQSFKPSRGAEKEFDYLLKNTVMA